MVLDLNKVYNIGLFYEPTKHADKNQIYPIWWLSLDTYIVICVNDIIAQYGYQTKEEIESSGFFVPFFQTKAEPLAEEFIKKECPYYDQEVQRVLRVNKEKGEDTNYHRAFHSLVFSSAEYAPIFDQYQMFVRKRLLKDAEAWCKKYHIRYKK